MTQERIHVAVFQGADPDVSSWKAGTKSSSFCKSVIFNIDSEEYPTLSDEDKEVYTRGAIFGFQRGYGEAQND